MVMEYGVVATGLQYVCMDLVLCVYECRDGNLCVRVSVCMDFEQPSKACLAIVTNVTRHSMACLQCVGCIDIRAANGAYTIQLQFTIAMTKL